MRPPGPSREPPTRENDDAACTGRLDRLERLYGGGAVHSLERIRIDPFELPGTLMRLPGLLEGRGDSAAARAYRARFAELWRKADPGLRQATGR